MVVGNSASSPVCKSLTATLLPGCWSWINFAAPIAVSIVVSAGLGLTIKKDLELIPLAVLAHLVLKTNLYIVIIVVPRTRVVAQIRYVGRHFNGS
jgi:hypothetical protein